MSTLQSSPLSSPVSSADLQQRIERLYDHLYANSPVRTPHGIATEVGKILHAAMYIESKRPRLFPKEAYGQFAAFEFDRAQLKILERCDGVLCAEVAATVREQFAAMTREWQLYEPGTTIALRDSDIAYCCAQLNQLVFSDRTRDIFGDALEIFRGHWAKRASGQFFTDQRVTRLAIDLLGFNPTKGDDLVDICAGTGGFLLAGLNHIRNLAENSAQASMHETRLVELASASLKGQEVDQTVCDIANSTLAARLSSTQHPLVALGDSLQPDAFLPLEGRRIQYGMHLCAATNPPFGTKTTLKDFSVLRHYDLARNGGGTTTRPPEVLLIEQNVKLLKPGKGRLAIVTPYQILSGPQSYYVREWLLRHTHLIAVVDLPADTFQPHTGTKASLLVVRRRKQPLSDLKQVENESVFMSLPRWIGHDRRGNPVFRRAADGSVTDVVLSDLEDVGRAYKVYRDGGNPTDAHSPSFTVPLAAILADPELRINALFQRPKLGSAISGKATKLDTFTYKKLREVVHDIFYPGRFKRNYVDYYKGAVPFLGGSNVSQLIVSTDKWIRHDDSKINELRVKAGWILVTRSGTTGIVSTVPAAWNGYAMSEHIIRIVPDPKKLEPEYLHLFLRTRYAQDVLARGVFGSVIDEINPEYIGNIEVPIPTSTRLLSSIVKRAKAAEEARNQAIEDLLGALEQLDATLD